MARSTVPVRSVAQALSNLQICDEDLMQASLHCFQKCPELLLVTLLRRCVQLCAGLDCCTEAVAVAAQAMMWQMCSAMLCACTFHNASQGRQSVSASCPSDKTQQHLLPWLLGGAFYYRIQFLK